MPLTILSDVIMPDVVIAAGVAGKNLRLNARSQNQAGYERVNIIWTRTLRQYQLGIVPMSVAAWQAIEGLHEVTEGGAYGFLMADPKDSAVATGAGLLQPWTTAAAGLIGAGFGLPTCKLFKRYTSIGSTRSKDRQITRPQPTPALLRAGLPVTIGAAPGNAAVDLTTGTVTFVADTSQALSSITVGASTVLNFANGTGIVAALNINDRVYLSGITGTAAAALNGLSHIVTAKGATSLTVSTSTAGLAVTAPGTAYKYPQPSESLTWTGRFFVPVHFQTDEIDWDLLVPGSPDSRMLAGQSVVLQEVRE